MKKFIISAIALNLILVSCSADNSILSTEKEIAKQTNSSTNENVETNSINNPNKSGNIMNYSTEAMSTAEDFKLYKATINFPRVASKNPLEIRSAKSFALISYSNMITHEYIVNGELYNDNGTGNDLIADDEIYTSDSLFQPETTPYNYRTLKYDASPDFTAHDKIRDDFANGNLQLRSRPRGVKGFVIGAAVDFLMGCSYYYSTAGTSLLGFSCSSGCFFIDCR